MKKRIIIALITVASVIFVSLFVMVLLNPGRTRFNELVFESNYITSDQVLMRRIRKVNEECFRTGNYDRVARRDYVLYSIYDVQLSDTETVHIQCFLNKFWTWID